MPRSSSGLKGSIRSSIKALIDDESVQLRFSSRTNSSTAIIRRSLARREPRGASCLKVRSWHLSDVPRQADDVR